MFIIRCFSDSDCTFPFSPVPILVDHPYLYLHYYSPYDTSVDLSILSSPLYSFPDFFRNYSDVLGVVNRITNCSIVSSSLSSPLLAHIRITSEDAGIDDVIHLDASDVSDGISVSDVPLDSLDESFSSLSPLQSYPSRSPTLSGSVRQNAAIQIPP